MAEDAAVTTEHKVKAAYLLNFAHFVNWPADAFVTTNSPFFIGILGDDRFGPFLDELARGETIGNRPIIILRSRSAKDLLVCQIVFVSRSERKNVDSVLAAIGGGAVLTVGESDGFAAQGGVVNLYVEANKVRFEVNPAAARRGGLELRAQLLRLARIVDPAAGRTASR